MDERKVFLRVRSHMMTDSSEFLNGWDQRNAWIRFSQSKKYVEALQLVLFMAVQNPGIDLNVLFKTDIQELGEASGHIGLLYSKDGGTMLARTMYDPENFGEPGEDYRGQTELYKNGEMAKKVYFGWAINGKEMPYFNIDRISSLEDAKAFFKWAGDNIGGGFHPDTPFSDYVDGDGEELFAPEEAERYDGLMDEARDLFDTEEEMYECLESVTGLMAAVNGGDKKYPIGTKIKNNSSGYTMEVVDVDGIDDYKLQNIGQPETLSNYFWVSEEDFDKWIRREAWEIAPADAGATEPPSTFPWNIVFNGFKVGVEFSPGGNDSRNRKSLYFEAVGIAGADSGVEITGDIRLEWDNNSEGFDVEEIEFDDESHAEVLFHGIDHDGPYCEDFNDALLNAVEYDIVNKKVK